MSCSLPLTAPQARPPAPEAQKVYAWVQGHPPGSYEVARVQLWRPSHQGLILFVFNHEQVITLPELRFV